MTTLKKKRTSKNKENVNKHFFNSKTLSSIDNFISTCCEHPVNENIANTNGKNTPEASEKRNQLKKDNNKDNNNNENRDKKNNINVYILGDSMVKKLNGVLLIKKNRHKHLFKVSSFSGAKIS